MKEITYIARSKNKSVKFDTHSYLLNLQPSESGKLLIGEQVTYGYLDNSYKLGAKRGWFKKPVSILVSDKDKFWIDENGIIKIKQLN